MSIRAWALRDAMILGTAGFTAALCVDKLLRQLALTPGERTGSRHRRQRWRGFECCRIAAIGHRSVLRWSAVTGKDRRAGPVALELGASTFLSREEAADGAGKPLLAERWGGRCGHRGRRHSLQRRQEPEIRRAAWPPADWSPPPQVNASVLPFILRQREPARRRLGFSCRWRPRSP